MARPSDCADLRVINQLDGFSAQPRITIPRTGDIDLRSANSQTVHPVKIGARIKQSSPAPIDARIGQAVVNAAASVAIVGSRDGLPQTVIDYMPLVRQIEAGVDVDGDGARDLNPQRIHYAGQSFGGIYGTIFAGVEPSLKALVPNVPGGSITEVARLGGFRVLTAIALATRSPQLLNLPPLAGVPFPFNLQFNENMPLRDQPLHPPAAVAPATRRRR